MDNGCVRSYLVQLDLEGSPASGFKGLSPLAHEDSQAEERSPKDLEACQLRSDTEGGTSMRSIGLNVGGPGVLRVGVLWIWLCLGVLRPGLHFRVPHLVVVPAIELEAVGDVDTGVCLELAVAYGVVDRIIPLGQNAKHNHRLCSSSG